MRESTTTFGPIANNTIKLNANLMSLTLNIFRRIALIGTVLTAFSGCSENSPAPQVQIQLPPPAAAPTNINTVPGDSQAILTWSPVENADSYNLYIKTLPGVSPQIFTTPAQGLRHENATSPHIISDLENGKTYYLILTSVNAGGESAASQELSITPITSTPIPATPTAITTKAGANKIELNWGESTNALRYQIYITYPDDAQPTLAGTTQRHTSQKPPFIFSDLENNKTYFFALSAENETGESDLSAVISASPKQKSIRRPAAPDDFSVSNNLDGSVTIDWDETIEIEQYNLFIGHDARLSSRNYKRLDGGKALWNVKPPYILNNIEEKNYYFLLNAENANGVSRDTKTLNLNLAPLPIATIEPITAEQAITPPPIEVIEKSPLIEVAPQPVIVIETLEKEDGNRPYLKLGINGELLDGQRKKYNTQPWACVKHKETGTMWEVKTLDGSFRDLKYKYPWQGDNNTACTNDICSAAQYVERINQINLCGYDDWRLPSSAELATLLDMEQTYPTPKTNIRFFPNTGHNFYWSSTLYKYDQEFARFIYFSSGYDYFDIKTNPMNIRVIRQEVSPSSN